MHSDQSVAQTRSFATQPPNFVQRAFQPIDSSTGSQVPVTSFGLQPYTHAGAGLTMQHVSASGQNAPAAALGVSASVSQPYSTAALPAPQSRLGNSVSSAHVTHPTLQQSALYTLPHLGVSLPPISMPSLPTFNMGVTSNIGSTQPTMKHMGLGPSNSHAIPTVPTHFRTPQIKAMDLPKFSGNDNDYLQWRQRFVQTLQLEAGSVLMSDEYKMNRLREALDGGKAASLVAGILDGPGAYEAAWTELESWYGGDDRHLEKQIQEIIVCPKISSERDVDALHRYVVKLRHTLANMKVCGSQPGRELYVMATEKVPKQMLVSYLERYGQYADITTFADWLAAKVRTLKLASDRVSTGERTGRDVQPNRLPTSSGKPRLTLAAGSNTQPTVQPTRPPSSKPQPTCRKCEGSHYIEQCPGFQGLNVAKRWDLVRLLDLCSCCLRSGHWAKDCKASKCGTCNGGHHSTLHSDRSSNVRSTSSAQTGQGKPQSTTKTKAISNVGAIGAEGNSCKASLMTVPVEIQHGDVRVRATALLDSGSDCSYITTKLEKALSLQGTPTEVQTTVLGGSTVSNNTRRVSVEVCHDDDVNTTTVNAFVLPVITAEVESVDWSNSKAQWKHLQSIPFSAPADSTVDILIGVDAAQLHSSIDEKCGQPGEPVARKTPLGWVCFGPTVQSLTSLSSSVAAKQGGLDGNQLSLDDMVKNMYALDMQPTAQHGERMSLEERSVEEFTEKTMHLKDGRVTASIPWKSDGPCGLSSNRTVAARSRFHKSSGSCNSWAISCKVSQEPALVVRPRVSNEAGRRVAKTRNCRG